MRAALREWALNTLPSGLIQFMRKEVLPCQRKSLRLMRQLKKPYLLKKISSNPHSALAQMDMGDLFFHLGELEEAIRHYEKAIEIDPDLFRA